MQRKCSAIFELMDRGFSPEAQDPAGWRRSCTLFLEDWNMSEGPNTNKLVKKQKRRRRAARLFTYITAVFLAFVLTIQMVSLYKKKQLYENKEAALQAEKADLKEESKALKGYEAYTKSSEYVEDTAKSKLGMLHENEIIFREKK